MRTVFTCIFLLITINVLYAQQQRDTVVLDAQWLTSKEGLSQGMINSILQDKEGYIWFATKDGLNKYDGYNITVYHHNPDDPYSLPDNYVTKIGEDGNGNFWVCTLTAGIYLFEKNTEKFYPAMLRGYNKESLGSNIVSFIVRKNELLVQTISDINIYDISWLHPDDYINSEKKIITPVFSYNNIQRDAKYKYRFGISFNYSWFTDGSLFIRTSDTLFYCRQELKVTYWVINGYSPAVCNASKSDLNDVIFDPDPHIPGKVFYLFKNNLYQFDITEKRSRLIAEVSKNKSPGYLKFQSLPDGTVYVFMSNELPLVIDPLTGHLRNVMVRRGAENFSAVYSDMCRDSSGVLWYGTAGFGVYKIDSHKPPFSIYKADDNIDALKFLYGSRWIPVAETVKKKIYTGFHNIVQDRNGVFWFTNFLESKGMTGELVAIDPAKNSFTRYNFFHAENYGNTSIFTDRDNAIWIFCDEGLNKKMLYRFSRQTGRADIAASFPAAPLSNSQYPFVSAWLQDTNNNLWFATVQGIFMYTPSTNSWKHWQNIPGNTASISSNMLFTICGDPKEPSKYLWIGTNGSGFFRFEMATGKCIRYNDKDGLPNNVVYAILSDKAGNLWLSTNRGLSCFDPVHKTFRNFSKEDNLPGDEFNRSEYFTLPDGRLMFGGVDGYTIFNPSEVLKTRPAVPVVFTGLSISNKKIDWQKDKNIIASPLAYTKKIVLHPGQNMFTISFASLDYRSNEKKLYTYKLDGFDNGWTNPSVKNEATYTNLAPGTYTFHVKGTNTDGVWNAQGISMAVIVLPYWYQTLVFKLVLVLLIAGGLYALYKYRLNQKLRLLEIRNRIAGDLHDEIGSTLSSISLSSTIIQQKINNENDDVQNLLQQISSNTDNMMEAMSDIVWAINTRNDSFESLVNRMRAFAVEMLEPQGVEVHFAVSNDVLNHDLDMIQRKNIYLLFKEAVNNAAKYAACKNVWVSIKQHGRKISMQIKDDGKGFGYNDGMKSSGENSFGGNGLPGMHKRAQDMKGLLTIESEEGKGTVIGLEFMA